MNKANKEIEAIRKNILSKFKCQGCGNCCKLENGYVYINEEEANQIARYLNLSLWVFKEKYVLKENGWLVISSPRHNPNCFLDKHQQCLIYPFRPKECQSYPNWPYLWRSYESLIAETNLCPGLKAALQQVTP